MLGCGCEGNQVSYLLGSPPACEEGKGLWFPLHMCGYHRPGFWLFNGKNLIGSLASVEGLNESSFFFFKKNSGTKQVGTNKGFFFCYLQLYGFLNFQFIWLIIKMKFVW